MFLTVFNYNPPRSEIHGRGLFCKRNIEGGEMVIEYAGNVIRSVLTDKREKYYDGKVRKWCKISIISPHNDTYIFCFYYHACLLFIPD